MGKGGGIGALAGAVAGAALAPFTGGTSMALAAGLGAGLGATVGSSYETQMDQKKVVKDQERQAQALIAEQKNAEATAKSQMIAARKATHANDTQTNFTTALGAVNEDKNGTKKKKTLLGS